MFIIKGYCDRKEAVRTFYEGLLRLAMAHPDNNEMLDDHVMNKIVAYNKFKSPIIESYLKSEYSKDDEYSIRQVHVKLWLCRLNVMKTRNCRERMKLSPQFVLLLE